MTGDGPVRDQALEVVFQRSEVDVEEGVFTASVIGRTERMDHRRLVFGLIIALILGLGGVLVDEFAEPVTELLLTSLIPLEGRLVEGVAGALLAPLNTVGGVLSAVLFLMRRVFRYLN